MTAGAAVCCLLLSSFAAQPAIEARDLAAYRLTRPVFDRFAHATRLIQTALKKGSAPPLFDREIAVTGEAVEMAASVKHRLETDPVLAGALFAADIDAREYTTFALTLFGARLAHGFVRSGALRYVPAGLPRDNVAFIEANERDVAATLALLELEG